MDFIRPLRFLLRIGLVARPEIDKTVQVSTYLYYLLILCLPDDVWPLAFTGLAFEIAQQS